MENIIERFKKATNKKDVFPENIRVSLSFAQYENSIKLELLQKLLKAENINVAISDMYLNETSLTFELKDIERELRQ
jgi:hypothetical protein